MNRIKIFLGSACMLFAIGAIAATKLTTTVDPEYYLTTGGICVEFDPASGCTNDTPANCRADFSATQQNRPVYDNRTQAGVCQNQLHRP